MRSPHAIGARVVRLGFALLAVLLVVLATKTASAYPWMIRHDYTGCATCHADPSGGGLLTPYGRAQGDLLLRTRYDGMSEEAEPSKAAGFLWGLFGETPEWLLAGGELRTLALGTKIDGSPLLTDFILMQADVQAEVRVGGFRADASVGAVSSNGSAASVVQNFVSREHWLGYAFADEAFLVRAGRINLPYGIRSIEHTMFVRSTTRTDLNDTQQHGVAFAYTGELFRGELMGIVGNYQIAPDVFRERGYSGYLEMAPLPRVAFGVSSLVTHAAEDLYLRVANTRQAHGVFARMAPWAPLVLLLEGDVVLQSPEGAPKMNGYATMAQADLEPIQGVHAIATGESYVPGGLDSRASYGGWLGAAWFFAPHADVRADFMKRSQAFGSTTVDVTAYMAQFHVYL